MQVQLDPSHDTVSPDRMGPQFRVERAHFHPPARHTTWPLACSAFTWRCARYPVSEQPLRSSQNADD